MDRFYGKKKGIMLSGGMDSAIVASYMEGCDAYTFRFLDGKFKSDELKRAEYYAHYYGLKLHCRFIHQLTEYLFFIRFLGLSAQF